MRRGFVAQGIGDSLSQGPQRGLPDLVPETRTGGTKITLEAHDEFARERRIDAREGAKPEGRHFWRDSNNSSLENARAERARQVFEQMAMRQAFRASKLEAGGTGRRVTAGERDGSRDITDGNGASLLIEPGRKRQDGHADREIANQSKTCAWVAYHHTGAQFKGRSLGAAQDFPGAASTLEMTTHRTRGNHSAQVDDARNEGTIHGLLKSASDLRLASFVARARANRMIEVHSCMAAGESSVEFGRRFEIAFDPIDVWSQVARALNRTAQAAHAKPRRRKGDGCVSTDEARRASEQYDWQGHARAPSGSSGKPSKSFAASPNWRSKPQRGRKATESKGA